MSGARFTTSTNAALDRQRFVHQFAIDVQYYLTQEPRQLPSKYLYDDLGSALFEAICQLPWYAITRAETRLVGRHGAEILRRAAPTTVVELGSGSGEKLKTLLEAADPDARPRRVHIVDLSPAALDLSVRTLTSSVDLHVATHEATYETGLHAAAASFEAADRVLVLFLGSNIGNFDPPGCDALLRGIRGSLRPGDGLLLGTDLVKAEADLLLAYDDPLGVTAAFNRNVLVRVNRELGGDFLIDQFAHRAVWNETASRVEMHLVARTQQRVRVRHAGIEFVMEPDEVIWTESSYKFRRNEIRTLLESVGFRQTAQWVDERDAFALTLAEAMS